MRVPGLCADWGSEHSHRVRKSCCDIYNFDGKSAAVASYQRHARIPPQTATFVLISRIDLAAGGGVRRAVLAPFSWPQVPRTNPDNEAPQPFLNRYSAV